MTQEESQLEDILSDELKEKMGKNGNVHDLIGPNRKDKRKNQENKMDHMELTEEDIYEAKRMSKKSKKLHDQYLRKQEKEKKKQEYYEILQKYEISKDHRELLRSTREVGQTDTMKQRLSKLLKRYKAGLVLSTEEYELLFPQGHQDQEDQEDQSVDKEVNTVSTHEVKEFHHSEHKVSYTMKSAIENSLTQNQSTSSDFKQNDENNNAVVFDLLSMIDSTPSIFSVKSTNAILSSSSSTSSNSNISTLESKKKTNKPQESNLNSNLSKINPNISLGTNLLQQLHQLKSKQKSTSLISSPSLSSSFSSSFHSTSIPDSSLNESDKPNASYIPVPIENPVSDYTSYVKVNHVEITPNSDSITANTILSSNTNSYMQIIRDPVIAAQRMSLPICGMEQEIVEVISMNDVVILCGETGSGKSTQVPQFLYEYGYGHDGMIGITQPRRVATVSTAQRVAVELGIPISLDQQSNSIVGYQIRFDSKTVSNNTKIKFMTDGILLREVTNDLLLKEYRVIIIDEAHERNINTDILLGIISRTIKLRKNQYEEELNVWNQIPEENRDEYQKPLQPLKVVIMSATLRVEDFCNEILFYPIPPVIKVEARQYSVVTHFSKRTELSNYLSETFKKVVQIHRKLPDGGILVFLTGKKEVMHTCRKLERILNKVKATSKTKNSAMDNEETDENMLNGLDYEDMNDEEEEDDDDLESIVSNVSDLSDSNSISILDQNVHDKLDDKVDKQNKDEEDGNDMRNQMLREVLGITSTFEEKKQMEGRNNIKANTSNNEIDESSLMPTKALILPLYAMMPPTQQQIVFQPPPPGHRLIVIATNVAETSITIPGIKYVVDCGRQKERVLSSTSGVSKYEITWISKASAEQRKGRAGRTGPGHCYRLYSSAFYDQHMKLFRPAEILSTPLEDLLLQMRAMGITDIETFPFPTPPPKSSMTRALHVLINLGAIVKPNYKSTSILDLPDLSNNDNSTASSTDHSNDMKENRKVKLSAKQLLREKGHITELGRLLAKFPINPRYAKILVVAHRMNILTYAISLISILADKSPFLSLPSKTRTNTNEKTKIKTKLSIVSNPIDLEKDDDEDEDERNDMEDSEDWDQTREKAMVLRCHRFSDAMVRMNAFGAYYYTYYHSIRAQKGIYRNRKENSSKEIEGLCNSYGLSQIILSKAIELQTQLLRLCSTILHHSTNDIDNTPQSPPSSKQEILLRQILLTGFCDHIAKKIPVGSHFLGNDEKRSRRKRLTAYMSCDPMVTEPIYIHPQSALYKQDPTDDHPQYVIYNSLIKNERGDCTYMDCVTVISPSWIYSSKEDSQINKEEESILFDCPLLHWSEPLESPMPYYDRQTDKIMCYVIPKYGAHGWEFSPVLRSYDECMKYEISMSTKETTFSNNSSLGYRKRDGMYRWFARCLLEGQVLPELKHVLRKDLLKESTSIITDMKPFPKVSSLLISLVNAKVKNRSTLLTHLQSTNQRNTPYLMLEIQAFLPVDSRKGFRNEWITFTQSLQND